MDLRQSWSSAGTAIIVALLGVMLLAHGCAVASVALPIAAGVSNTAYGEYRAGDYVVVIEAPHAVCERAVQESCQHFLLTVRSWEADAGITTAKLRNARGDKFTLRIAFVGPGRTALYIRAGSWGDDLCSRQLACDVEANALRIQRAGSATRAR